MQKRALLALMILTGGPLCAQQGISEEEMEVQRCIWRCMAEFPLESPEYPQCVAEKCNEPAAAPSQPQSVAPAPPPVGPPWSTGPTQDGQGYFAGQYAPETDNILYYTCDAGGMQNLLLAGQVEGPAAVLTLAVDGQALGLWFEPTPGGYTSRLEPGSPVPGLIAGAKRVEIRNEAGWSLGNFAMAGAAAAINGARAACRL